MKSIEISIPVVVLLVVIIVSLVFIALIWFKYKTRKLRGKQKARV